MCALEHFRVHGYVILRGVLDDEQISALRAEADRVSAEAGTVCVRHLRSKSTIFDALALNPIKSKELLYASHRPVRSILFDKNEKMNWPVAWHQDLTVAVKKEAGIAGYGPWSVKDGAVHTHAPLELLQQMLTLRYHLDDTSADNGALRVIPGSHLLGKIESSQISEHISNGEVVCECQAGDLLVMSPLLLHASNKSTQVGRRRVIHVEYAVADALDPMLKWHEDLSD